MIALAATTIGAWAAFAVCVILAAGCMAVALDLVDRARHPRQCIWTRIQRRVHIGTIRHDDGAWCGHARCDDVIHATTRRFASSSEAEKREIPPPPIPLEAAPQHRKEQRA